jgi:hypothetical protein
MRHEKAEAKEQQNTDNGDDLGIIRRRSLTNPSLSSASRSDFFLVVVGAFFSFSSILLFFSPDFKIGKTRDTD